MRKAGLIAGLLTFAFVAAPALANKGDLIVADYNDSAIKLITPSGDVSTITSGPPLLSPNFVTFEPNGAIVGSDEGEQFAFRVAAGASAADPFADVPNLGGIDRAPNGNFVVADQDAEALLEVDRRSGDTSLITSGGLLENTYGIDVGPKGEIYAVNGDDGLVVRVTPAGQQSGVASDPLLAGGEDLARAANGNLFVANTDQGTVVKVNPNTGGVSGIATGLGTPYSVAVAPNGVLYTTDYDGAVVNRVDPASGDATEIAGVADGIAGPVGIDLEPPKCKGKVATIVGSTKRDKLKGSKFADVIVGLKGNDKIKGGKGKDRICGGKGKDKLSGQGGRDKLDGGPGKDKERQ